MNPVYAVDISQTPWGDRPLGITFPSLATLINLILQNSLTIAGVILLALLIFGGISLILGAGASDPKKTQQGQKTVTSALIGFLIVFLAYFIIQIIEVITGLDILNPSTYTI
jgi:hypothetical protein